MRRLLSLVRWLPVGDVARRAISEALADGWHETRRATGLTARSTRWLVTIAALSRILASVFTVFDQEHPMAQMMSDVRYALRRLRRSPLFATFSIATLALGIGATTAIFAAVHAVLSPDRGLTNLDRAVNVYHYPRGSGPIMSLSWGDFVDLRARQRAFDRFAAWKHERVALAAGGGSEAAIGEFVGGDYFEALGVPIAIGRGIQPADDRPDASPVVVLSHGAWQRLFGGAPGVAGTRTHINGVEFEIVGVAGGAFAGSFNNGLIPTLAWMPMATMASTGSPTAKDGFDLNERSRRWVRAVGRLAPGRTFEDASAEVSVIAKQLDLETPLKANSAYGRRPPPYEVSRPWTARRAADIVINENEDRFLMPMAATVMSVVGLVLLVACTNLANMMLARATSRRHELAIRLALGSSRWRLVREIVIESGLIAIGGALMGLAVARVLVVAMGTELSVGNAISLRLAPRLDATVLALAMLATIVAMLVAGLLPALQATRRDVRAALATDAAHGSVPRWRGRRVLIAAQVTVSIVLVAVAALCVAQVRATRAFDRGLDLNRLAIAQLDFATQQYDPQRALQIAAAAARQIASRPDVEAVSVSSGWPILLTSPGASVLPLAGAGGGVAEMIAATPSIFRTLGVSLESGRLFDGRDTGATSTIVISRHLAEQMFSTPAAAIGQQVRFKRRQWVGDPQHPDLVKTVIGVVSEVQTSSERESAAVYLPLDQQPERQLVITTRVSNGDPASVLGPMRAAISGIDPQLAIAQVATGPSLAGFEVVFLRVLGGLAAVLGSIALVLALAGLYGVLSHLIGRRTREIGVRIALGADRARILRMVLRDGLHPVVSGIVLGLAIGAIARMSLSPMFSRLAPAMDPIVLLLVPVLMLLAGALACYIPARRAANIDRNIALRD